YAVVRNRLQQPAVVEDLGHDKGSISVYRWSY
ncbi:hypothetical protein Tco_0594474, partial [Tanacetum coccineum]